eukprot:Blabericola_migrator_1__1646@NODE_1441_length_4539_cov_72_482111_g957_i0_p4_GENE_NODE_1441_length_4539_cov_72_482111_g957_i0NODE_1441_length_4539_cov_72_482111_g957_i0_p4_ORF_typecomplete_len312_score33_91_NODE_1441_length_4539_cov_72_482111_g957_i035314466
MGGGFRLEIATRTYSEESSLVHRRSLGPNKEQYGFSFLMFRSPLSCHQGVTPPRSPSRENKFLHCSSMIRNEKLEVAMSHLLEQLQDKVVGVIYEVNQEDFELDGYLLDEKAQRVVITAATRILFSILKGIPTVSWTTDDECSSEPQTASSNIDDEVILQQDWMSYIKASIATKGLRKVLLDEVTTHYALNNEDAEGVFMIRHSESISGLVKLVPSLASREPTPDPPPPRYKAPPPASHIAVGLAEIVLCEIMQTISVYANDHKFLTSNNWDSLKLVTDDVKPVLGADTALSALRSDPDLRDVATWSDDYS